MSVDKIGRPLKTHLSEYGVFYLAFLLMIFTIRVYYPGYMSPDSVKMLGMARDGVTINTYSPLMSYIWRVADWLIPGPGGMLIFQNLVYWFSLAVIAYNVNCNRLLGILFVLSGLWIPTFAMLGTIWKDVGMQGFLLMAVAAMLYGRRSGRIWPFVLAVLSLFLACGYRQNGMMAAAPLVIAVLSYFPWRVHSPRQGTDHRMVAAFYTAVAGTILGAFLGGLWLLKSYHIEDRKLWSAAMVHDLAAISVFQNTNYLPAYINRDNALTVEDLKHMYSPLHANSLFIPGTRKILEVPDPSPDKVVTYTLTDEQARELQFYWFTAVRDHFGSYMHHRLLMMERLLVLRTRQPWYAYIVGIDANPFGLRFRHSRLNHYVTRLTHFAAFSTPLYSAWVYYAVVTVCFLASLFWRFEYGLLVQCLGVSVWLYFLSIFVFGMSGDFRYNIWALSCAPLCIFLLLRGGAKEGSAKVCSRQRAIELNSVN